jgi:hypothetical protein
LEEFHPGGIARVDIKDLSGNGEDFPSGAGSLCLLAHSLGLLLPKKIKQTFAIFIVDTLSRVVI